MNETQTPPTRTPEPQTPDNQTPETQSIAKQRSLADRILLYSVAGSLLVNLGWLAWVSNSNLFGGGGVADLTPKLVKLVKPPIPQKPKPKKVKPPPPPPKQKIIPPKIRPLKPPPPHQVPRPRPQSRPQPLHRMAVATTHNTRAVSNVVVPETAPNVDQKPTASGDSTFVTPPAPTPPPPTPAPPPPKPEPPAPAPLVHHDPPPPPAPKPPPPPPPKPKIPDRDEPAIIGSFSDISLPEFDPSTLNTTSVTVTWEVDGRGHPSGIKFRPTGNSDVDNAIRSAIQGFRFKPAAHNGETESAHMEHTFQLGS